MSIILPAALHVGHSSIREFDEEPWSEIEKDPRGVMLMWEPPQKNAKYILGCDASEGITGWSRATRTDDDFKTDNGVVEVFKIDGIRELVWDEKAEAEEDRKQPGKRTARIPLIDKHTRQQGVHYRDLQVAEFAAPCDAVEIARVANVIGRLYRGDEEDEAELIWEAYPGCGMLTTQELLRLGYSNLWHWEYITEQAEETNRLGWRSGRESMKVLWYRSRRHLMQRNVVIRSKWLLDELAGAEIDMAKMRARACFIPGTKILQPGGKWKRIETIEAGDHVVNRLSETGTVGQLYRNYFSGDLVGIRTKGQPDTQFCTPEHYILAKIGHGKIYNRSETWTKAGDLKKGDCVFLPKQHTASRCPFTAEQLWVMGLWLAEGNYTRSDGILTDGINNTLIIDNTNKALLDEALTILKQWFPTNICPPRGDGWQRITPTGGTVQSREPRRETAKPSYWLNFGSYQAAGLFYQQMGEYCTEKRLSQKMMSYGADLLPLIAGYFDGNGTQRNNQEHDCNLYTASPLLARQLRRLLLDAGIWCSLQTHKRSKMPNVIMHVLNIKANDAARLCAYSRRMHLHRVKPCNRIERTAIGYWVPVDVVRTPYEGPVYDLAVNGEHSYTVESFAVHNSYGMHDDRLWSAAFAWWAGHDWTYSEDSQDPVTEAAPAADFQNYMPGLDDESGYVDWRNRATDDWFD